MRLRAGFEIMVIFHVTEICPRAHLSAYRCSCVVAQLRASVFLRIVRPMLFFFLFSSASFEISIASRGYNWLMCVWRRRRLCCCSIGHTTTVRPTLVRSRIYHMYTSVCPMCSFSIQHSPLSARAAAAALKHTKSISGPRAARCSRYDANERTCTPTHRAHLTDHFCCAPMCIQCRAWYAWMLRAHFAHPIEPYMHILIHLCYIYIDIKSDGSQLETFWNFIVAGRYDVHSHNSLPNAAESTSENAMQRLHHALCLFVRRRAVSIERIVYA